MSVLRPRSRRKLPCAAACALIVGLATTAAAAGWPPAPLLPDFLMHLRPERGSDRPVVLPRPPHGEAVPPGELPGPPPDPSPGPGPLPEPPPGDDGDDGDDDGTGGSLPAFPGAEGWGATTTGGRGGKILFVTTLADAGPGSLRAALAEPGPRTVLFRVAGVIRLASPLRVGPLPGEPAGDAESASHLTLAGHSAPGGGVTIAEYPLVLSGGVHDVVVRHLRFRNARREREGEPRSSGDGIELSGAERVVIDHCSFSWATDENVSLERGTNRDVTVQWSLVAEGLARGGHEGGPHSRGLNAARGADRVSIHHVLFASNRMRNPHVAGCSGFDDCVSHPEWPLHPRFDVRHNVVYNWERKGIHAESGAQANLVGNLLLDGPSTPPGRLPIEMQDQGLGTQMYLEGNEDPGLPDAVQSDLVEFPVTGTGGLRLTPIAAPAVTPTPTEALLDELLAAAGALPRDVVDRGILDEVIERSGAAGAPERTHESGVPAPEPGEPYPDADLDGMEDSWERVNGLDPNDPADAWGDLDADGYPNLEEYLESRVPF